MTHWYRFSGWVGFSELLTDEQLRNFSTEPLVNQVVVQTKVPGIILDGLSVSLDDERESGYIIKNHDYEGYSAPSRAQRRRSLRNSRSKNERS